MHCLSLKKVMSAKSHGNVSSIFVDESNSLFTLIFTGPGLFKIHTQFVELRFHIVSGEFPC